MVGCVESPAHAVRCWNFGVAVEEDRRVFLAQKTPEVAEGLISPGLRPLLQDLTDLVEPLDAHRVASTGLVKIFTGWQTREVPNGLNPDREAVEALSQSYGAIGVYVYAVAPARHGRLVLSQLCAGCWHLG